jgi:hypothetical protein
MSGAQQVVDQGGGTPTHVDDRLRRLDAERSDELERDDRTRFVP